MLAKYWRLRMINQTGQTMTFNDGAAIAIRSQPWKLGSDGAIEYGTVITEDLGFGAGETIVDDGEVEGAVVDNGTSKFYGVNGTFEITHDLDAAAGVCRLYREFSDVDNYWPSDADDFVITDLFPVAVLNIDNSGVDKSRSCNFSF